MAKLTRVHLEVAERCIPEQNRLPNSILPSMEAVDFTITTDIFDLEVERRSQPTPPHNGTARGTPQIET